MSNLKKVFYVEIIYSDETSFGFNVELEGSEHEVYANLMMISRGTLMASSAVRCIAYNDDGFDVLSYVNYK